MSRLNEKSRKRRRRASNFELSSGDRFIPSRSRMSLPLSNFAISAGEEAENWTAQSNPNLLSPEAHHSRQLALQLLSVPTPTSKVFRFDVKKKERYSEGYSDADLNSPKRPRHSLPSSHGIQRSRTVDKLPIQSLDIPGFRNDYYQNGLDWGRNDVIALALSGSVILWSSRTSSIVRTLVIHKAGITSDKISSVAWNGDASRLAVGDTNSGSVRVFDTVNLLEKTTKCDVVASFQSTNPMRVGALAWNGSLIACGSKNSVVTIHDIRQNLASVACLSGHRQEVCGLSWNQDGNVLASGGNDNLVKIWDLRVIKNECKELFTFEQHKSAVKALKFCPFQTNLLASGGGSADRTLKFWNTDKGTLITEYCTYSQIMGIEWNSKYHELATCHGVPNNEVNIWSYPSMKKVAELRGHKGRILGLSKNPYGTVLATAGSDEVLSMWNVWPKIRLLQENLSSLTEIR